MARDFDGLRDAMVQGQLKARGIRDSRVLEAMGRIPRHRFVPEALTHRAYDDGPLPIGEGQTISQPFMVAVMTEQLALKGNERVLEIGTGSGYQGAVLAQLCRQVYTIERQPGLAARAEALFRTLGIDNVSVYNRDGTLGLSEEAPFDGILVTAAAPTVPQALVEQLAVGGRLVIPVGDRWAQMLRVVQKRPDGSFSSVDSTPCVFVPLIGQDGWADE